VLGEHEGHQHYTIGQRRGIRIPVGHPLYVIDKDARTNTVTVGEREDLRAHGCIASEANWLIERDERAGPSSARATPGHSDVAGLAPGVDEPARWMRCTAKIRYNAQPVPARVRAVAKDHRRDACATDACATDIIEVRFDEAQYAVAPGQAVVCYEGDAVICGGWIEQALRE
jgi:tRNA-specific 2-thiouridylase